MTNGRPSANNSRTVLAAGVGTGGRTAPAGSGVLVGGGAVGVATGVCSAGSGSAKFSSAATGVAACVGVGTAVGASVGEAVGVAAGADDAVACSTLGALPSESPHAASSAASMTSVDKKATCSSDSVFLSNRCTPEILMPKRRPLVLRGDHDPVAHVSGDLGAGGAAMAGFVHAHQHPAIVVDPHSADAGIGNLEMNPLRRHH